MTTSEPTTPSAKEHGDTKEEIFTPEAKYPPTPAPTTQPAVSTPSEPTTNGTSVAAINKNSNSNNDNGAVSNDAIDTESYWKNLDFCDLMLPRPFAVLAQNWRSFFIIALLASTLRAFLAFLFDLCNGPNYGADYGYDVDYGNSIGDEDYEQTQAGQLLDLATMTMRFVNSLILFVATCLADGACIEVVANIYAGQPPLSAVVAIGTVAEKIVPLVGSCLLVSFGLFSIAMVFFLPILLLIVMVTGAQENAFGAYEFLLLVFLVIAVYVSIVTYLMYPAIVVENQGIVGSVKRSFGLTQGYLGKILALLVVYGLIKMMLGVVILSVTYTNTTAALVIRGVLSFLVNTFWIAIGAM